MASRRSIDAVSQEESIDGNDRKLIRSRFQVDEPVLTGSKADLLKEIEEEERGGEGDRCDRCGVTRPEVGTGIYICWDCFAGLHSRFNGGFKGECLRCFREGELDFAAFCRRCWTKNVRPNLEASARKAGKDRDYRGDNWA